MLIKDFNQTIDFWIGALDRYDFTTLCAKQSSGSWSIGQMYLHLIADTNFYIDQIKRCLLNNDYATEEASENGKAMLQQNEFPDVALEGSPDNALIPQPDSKDQLLLDLKNIKAEMNDLAVMITQSPIKGKTKHPGLMYFSAQEWLQFADMHFRHHLKQKKRIDHFLESIESKR
jgi:hypothetical protein